MSRGTSPCSGRGSHPPRGPGWSRAAESQNREGTAPRSTGITSVAVEGTSAARMEPRREAPGSGRSPASGPGGWGRRQQLRLRQEQSSTFRPGARRRSLLGTQVRSAVTSQTPGITTSPKGPLFWPGEPARSREEPPRSKGAEGRERGGGGGDTLQEVSRTPAYTTPIPFPGHNPSNLLAFPRHPPRSFIPELTAGRPPQPANQKQNEEAKTGLGATHLSLCHLDPNFAGVRGCQVRTGDPLPLARSCLWTSAWALTAWAAALPTGPAPDFLEVTARRLRAGVGDGPCGHTGRPHSGARFPTSWKGGGSNGTVGRINGLLPCILFTSSLYLAALIRNAIQEGLTCGSWSGGQGRIAFGHAGEDSREKRVAGPERREPRPPQDREVARGSSAGPRPRSRVRSHSGLPERASSSPRTPDTSLQRLTHWPGGPPGGAVPQARHLRRGPSSAPARGSPLQRSRSERRRPSSPSRGRGASGRDSKERVKLKTPRRVSERLLWLRTVEFQPALERPWLDRASENRAPPIAGAGCGGGEGGERNVDMDRRDRYRKTRPTGRVSWKDRNRHELCNAKGFREPQSCPRYLGRVRLFAAPWTAAHQTPLSMDSPGKNTGVGCRFLLHATTSSQEETRWSLP
ncbi:uncharacterized protein ACBT57_004175 [Dama dama]